MKRYVETDHICKSDSHDFLESVANCIRKHHNKGFEVDVNYSSSAIGGNIYYSALILAYSHRPRG